MSQPTALHSVVDPAEINPDDLEVVDGRAHENLEGWVPNLASDQDLQAALEKAFDYRGDITLTLKSGERLEAFVFNRRTGTTLADSYVQYYEPKSPDKKKASYAEIARIEFTGRDRAAGKHWEDWLKKYSEKKAAGEKNIGLHPEELD